MQYSPFFQTDLTWTGGDMVSVNLVEPPPPDDYIVFLRGLMKESLYRIQTNPDPDTDDETFTVAVEAVVHLLQVAMMSLHQVAMKSPQHPVHKKIEKFLGVSTK